MRRECFTLQKNSKYLYLLSKMDLDFCGCVLKHKTDLDILLVFIKAHLTTESHRTDFDIWDHSMLWE